MRNIRTFITHILWDEEKPDDLCGSLRMATSSESQNFKSQEELITLLKDMISSPDRASLENPSENPERNEI